MKKHSNNLKDIARNFMVESVKTDYSYNFKWLSRPIIQYPQDIVATQEIIWKVKPDLIIETGIAHGGSLVFSASMLALLDYCDAQESGILLNPEKPNRKVIGVDVDIRTYNRDALDEHPMRNRMELIEGSSIDPAVVDKVHKFTKSFKRIMVFLDSNHTHDHVLSELEAYAGLTSVDSYCVVFDTIINDLPDKMSSDRPWGIEDNPKTAVKKFLKDNDEFIIDKSIEENTLMTVAPDGFLKKII